MKKLLWLTSISVILLVSSTGGAADMSSTIANQLQLEMRQKTPPAGIVEDMVRIRGIVASVGDEGVLLRPAGAVRWIKKTRSQLGTTTTAWELELVENLQGGAAFVEGMKGKIGQTVTADVHRASRREMFIDGRKVKVMNYKTRRPSR